MIGPGCADRHRPVLRGVPERARRLPGHDGPVVGRARRPSVRLALPDHHHPRPGRARGRAGRRARASTAGTRSSAARWAACACSSGPSATASVSRGRSSSRWARRRPPSRSRCATCRSARSAPTRTGGAATTTTPRRATDRTTGWRSRASIGHISYRSELELAARFGRDHQPGEEPFAGGRYAVESYLELPRRQAGATLRRQHATSCCREAMNHHDVGPRIAAGSRPHWRPSPPT